MTEKLLLDLQASVQDKSAFTALADYSRLSEAFLEYIARVQPTRIVSPTQTNYIFYQHGEEYGYRLTRPLNTNLFIEVAEAFKDSFERLMLFLHDLRKYQGAIVEQKSSKKFIEA
jgi:hypothetical protein